MLGRAARIALFSSPFRTPRMTIRERGRYPEIFCDFNAQMTVTGYSLERRGSIADLEALGLTLEEAVGKRFTFVTEDSNDAGEADTIMLDGLVVRDPKWGYLAVDDGDGFYWRSQRASS